MEQQVVFQFEKQSGQLLGRLFLNPTEALQQASENVLNLAKALVDLPDDEHQLGKYFAATEKFGSSLKTVGLEQDQGWKDLEHFPEGCRLTIIAPWKFHRLSWEAVGLRDSWLGVRYAIKRVVTDQSINTAVEGWNPQQEDSSTAKLTIFLGEGPGLVGTVSECNLAEDWMRKYERMCLGKGEHVRSLITEIPTRDLLLDSLSNSRFLHYSGHGHLSPTLSIPCFAPEDSNVDGYVTSVDIEQLERVPSYLYLNGCGLLSHVKVKNGSVHELPLEFQRKGAVWVVGPTVRFLTYRYYELIRNYYKALHPKLGNPAEAMRESRRFLVRGGGKFKRELPLALQTVVYGIEDHWSLNDIRKELPREAQMEPFSSKSKKQYPTCCSQCSMKIESKYGDYSEETAVDPLCRNCFHEAGKEFSAEDSLAKDSKTVWNPVATNKENSFLDQGKNNPSVSTRIDHDPTESEQSLVFRRKLGDNAQQFTKFYHPEWKREVACEIVSRRVTRKDRDEQRPFLAKPVEVGFWTEVLELVQADWRHRAQILGQFVIRYVEPSHLSPLTKAEVESTFREMREQCADSQKKKNDDFHRFFVLVSALGFDDEAWLFIDNPGVAWRDGGRSLLIHDPVKHRTGFAKADHFAYSIENFFRAHAIDEEFQQTMAWLEEQLPLRQSLSVRVIAEKTGFSAKVVESAMRIFARRHHLSTMESATFGFCIEDSLVSKTKRDGRSD